MAYRRYHLVAAAVKDFIPPEQLPDTWEQWSNSGPLPITPAYWEDEQTAIMAVHRRAQAETVIERAIGYATHQPLPPIRRGTRLLAQPHWLLKLFRFRLLVVVWTRPTRMQRRLHTYVGRPRRSNSHFLVE